MSDVAKCRVCGRPLNPFDRDGLCSGSLSGSCYGEFTYWAAAEKGLRVIIVNGGEGAVDWSRPEVQVAFDQWAAMQPPMEAA